MSPHERSLLNQKHWHHHRRRLAKPDQRPHLPLRLRLHLCGNYAEDNCSPYCHHSSSEHHRERPHHNSCSHSVANAVVPWSLPSLGNSATVQLGSQADVDDAIAHLCGKWYQSHLVSPPPGPPGCTWDQVKVGGRLWLVVRGPVDAATGASPLSKVEGGPRGGTWAIHRRGEAWLLFQRIQVAPKLPPGRPTWNIGGAPSKPE